MAKVSIRKANVTSPLKRNGQNRPSLSPGGKLGAGDVPGFGRGSARRPNPRNAARSAGRDGRLPGFGGRGSRARRI